MITTQLGVSEFKAHCTEEIRAVEKGDTVIEPTRHGKKVALVKSTDAAESPPDLKSWLGSGKRTVNFGPGYDAEDWGS
jgi:antitoxin (DNA-binding transcriptional repressor) of toxin-antitoxin stability system